MIDIKDMNDAPSIGEIGDFISLPLFETFFQYIDREYRVIYKIEYCKEVWARGWNVKFRKAASLFTIFAIMRR